MRSDFAQQVLDALPVTIYTTDLDGRITSANRSWSSFAAANGAPELEAESQVCGASLWGAFSDPAYKDQVRDAMEQLRSGRANRVAWEFPCSSPTEERVFLLQITALRDAAQQVSGFVFSTVDITPSHKSREALINTGLALARPVDIDRVFHEVGHQVLRGIPTDAFAIWVKRVGEGPALAYATVPPGETARDRAMREIAIRVLESGSAASDRLPGFGLLLASPMNAGGLTTGAMVLLSPALTSRQDFEEAERVLATLAAQTATAVDRVSLVQQLGHKHRLEAIGEVATGIAHELRNPLFGISSAAQLLRFRAPQDAVVDRNVGRILKEVERLNRMVTSLLDFGRPRKPSFASGDPDAIWDDLLESQRPLLEARQLELVRTRHTPPAAVRLEGEQLAQVFLNLLVNAVDHAPPGSAIHLRTALRAEAWVCALTNHGPVVPSEVLQKVFQMFFSTKPGGTGIGLAICQRIIEEHRGTIEMTSSPEAGTTVTVSLPLERAETC